MLNPCHCAMEHGLLFSVILLGLSPAFIVISNACEKSPIIFFRFLVAMLHRNDKTLSFVIDELSAMVARCAERVANRKASL